jgi:parallel beta-helix repeat protein
VKQRKAVKGRPAFLPANNIKYLNNNSIGIMLAISKPCMSKTFHMTCCNNPIFKNFIIVVSLFFHVNSSGNVYYVSTSGNDSRTSVEAQNPSTPWKTINKINSFSSLKPGDSVLFQKGGTYYGTLTPSASGSQTKPIVFGAYGIGANPIISGFTELTAWSLASGNIYYAILDVAALNMVTIDGLVQSMGRYPNSSYLTYTAHSGNTSITGASVGTIPFDPAGGELVIRKNRWILDKHPLTQKSGTTLTYSGISGSSYTPTDGNGYFIQGHLATLDKDGEWFYDIAAKKLYVHFGSGTPTGKVVKAASLTQNVYVNYWTNFSFRDISFEGANLYGAYLIGTSNISFDNCTFSDEGDTGIWGSSLQNFSIKNSRINNALNHGIYFEQQCNNSVADSLIVTNTGMIAGAGRSGDLNQIGILMIGDGNTIQNCSVLKSGYIGIYFQGNNTLITHNLVDSFCTIKDDGSGIYTYTGFSDANIYVNRRVIGNIVVNGVGAGDGTYDNRPVHVHGIYMDDATRNVELADNTFANCGGSGIFIHGSHHLNILNNRVFNNTTSLLMFEDNNAGTALIRSNDIRHNQFFAKGDLQTVTTLRSINNDMDQFGTMDSNYYCKPIGDSFVIETLQNKDGASVNHGFDLYKWKSFSGKDLSSKTAPKKNASYSLKSLVGNNLLVNGSFDTNLNGTSFWAPANNAKISLVNSKLDGGSLQLSYTSQSTSDKFVYLTLDIGAIQPGKNYLLKFSLLGTKNKGSIQAFLRQKNTPYSELSIRKYCQLSTSRTENELLFSMPTAESAAFLVLQVNEYDSTFCIDNIVLKEADVDLLNPDDFIRFEYNPSNSPKVINVAGKAFVDVEGNLYDRNFSLAPWTSIILLDTRLSNLTSQWTGATSNQWSNPANWINGLVPSLSSDVVIPTGKAPFPILTDNAAVNALNIQKDATLTIGANTLSVSGAMAGTGALIGLKTSNLSLAGNHAQNLNFAPGSEKLNNLSLNHFAPTIVTLNTPLLIYTSIDWTTTNATLDLNNKAVTLLSDATATASIGQVFGNLTGATNVTVERFIPKNNNRAWRLLSVPTLGQTINQAWQEGQTAGVDSVKGYGTILTSNSANWAANGYDDKSAGNSLLAYDPAADDLFGVSSTASSIATASGYLIYIRGDRSVKQSATLAGTTQTILRSTGKLYLGTQPPITIQADRSALIGNVYPSAIDLRKLILGGGTTNTSISIWDPKLIGSYGLGGYQTLTKDGDNYIVIPGGGSFGSSGSISNTVQSGQAFFVYAIGSNGSLTFTESAKTPGSNNNVFSPPAIGNSKRFIINLSAITDTAINLADGTMQLFDDSYDQGVDELDAKKRFNFGESIFISSNNEQLAVEKRTAFAPNDTVFLGIDNLKQLNYQLELDPRNIDLNTLSAWLEDGYTNMTTNFSLNTKTTVNFSVDANVNSKAANRFRIVFKQNQILPLKFVDVTAARKLKNVEVYWATTDEATVGKYQIERSNDGSNFVTVGEVTGKKSAGSANYIWTDQYPLQTLSYYRVKAIDDNGSNIYSSVVKVNYDSDQIGVMRIYPNVSANNNITLEVTDLPKGVYSLLVTNGNGQVLLNKNASHAGGFYKNKIQLPNLSSGLYFLELKGSSTSQVQIFTR